MIGLRLPCKGGSRRDWAQGEQEEEKGALGSGNDFLIRIVTNAPTFIYIKQTPNLFAPRLAQVRTA